MMTTKTTGTADSSTATLDTTVATTSVDLGGVQVNLDAFKGIATKLIEAGWDGDEENLERAGTRKNPVYKFGTCSFSESDLEQIQAVVKRQLAQNPTATKASSSSSSAASVASEANKIPQNTYENALSSLREHLVTLQNPFLAKRICDKCSQVDFIGWYQIDEIIRQAIDETWPKETKDLLKTFFSQFHNRAKSCNQTNVNETVNSMTLHFTELMSELTRRTEANMKEFEGWKEFLCLFDIPVFAVLNNTYYSKIKRYIDQGATEDLRDYISGLERIEDGRKIIDVESVKQHLVTTDYEEDLDTLLSQVIKKKPEVKRGIVTYWNQPNNFFEGKLLSIHAPSGEMYEGFITKCETKEDGSKEFQMDDGVKILIKNRMFETTITQNLYYRNVIKSLEEKFFNEGDVIKILHNSETADGAPISPGDYLLQHFKRVPSSFFSQDNNYNEYQFYHLEKQACRYRVRVEIDEEDRVVQIAVAKWNNRSKKFENDSTMSLEQFQRTYLAWKKVPKNMTDINQANAERCILVKQEIDEERARRQQLEQINKEIKELRQKFQKPENASLMDDLLDNLVKNEMKGVDMNLLNGPYEELAKDLRAISRKFYDTLKTSRTPEQILLETVLDANYVKLVSIKDNILIARTMQLLKESKEHIDHIKGRDLILFMGNTGAGKSTSIAYLMKAPLEMKKNHVGEEVLQVSDRAGAYPKIGQSIGTSETIYTQGYQMPEAPYLLGDCPGFNDTRGGDYELCTNFSIDQAVLRAKDILSLVIVIPVNAFLLDRGNPVIDLVSSVQDRFPSAFDPGKPTSGACVHLLLTKSAHVKADSAKSVIDGRRFEQLVRETQKQIDEMRGHGASAEGFKEEPIERRLRIWKAILQMHQANRVHLIDTKDKVHRKELLEAFSKTSNPFNKHQYLPAMAGEYMHKKFGDSVQLAAHAWINLILRKFLEVLPDEINTCKAQESQRRTDLLQRQAEKENQIKKIQVLGENAEKLRKHLARLEQNQDGFTDETLKAELLQETADRVQSLVQQHTTAVAQIKETLKIKQAGLDTIIEEIQKYEADININRTMITTTQTKIEGLQKGEHHENLFRYKADPNKEMTIKYVDPAVRKKAHEEVRELTSEERYGLAYQGLAKDYKGTTIGLANIKPGYRIVPSDEQERRKFLSTSKGGGFEAKVTGLRNQVDFDSKASSDGKRISYAYSLVWDGTANVPSISIDFTVPNVDYNYAEINTAHSQIGAMETQVNTWNVLLKGGGGTTGAQQRKEAIDLEIKALEQKQQEHEKAIEELQTDHALKQVKEMIEGTKKNLEAVEKEQKENEDLTSINKKIEGLTQEIQVIEHRIAKLNKNRRNLAIIIKTQWDSAKLLREFADHVSGLGDHADEKITEGQHLNATVQTCQEYSKLFDQHKDTLLLKIKEDFGF